jgi:hypothetical protein
MDYEEAKDLCINGLMTTRDAAHECGWNIHTFYASIQKDIVSHSIFKANSAIRSKLKPKITSTEHELMVRYRRSEDLAKERRIAVAMKKYHSKTLDWKARKARELGVSYGKFMAMMRGFGGIVSDEA